MLHYVNQLTSLQAYIYEYNKQYFWQYYKCKTDTWTNIGEWNRKEVSINYSQLMDVNLQEKTYQIFSSPIISELVNYGRTFKQNQIDMLKYDFHFRIWFEATSLFFSQFLREQSPEKRNLKTLLTILTQLEFLTVSGIRWKIHHVG